MFSEDMSSTNFLSLVSPKSRSQYKILTVDTLFLKRCQEAGMKDNNVKQGRKSSQYKDTFLISLSLKVMSSYSCGLLMQCVSELFPLGTKGRSIYALAPKLFWSIWCTYELRVSSQGCFMMQKSEEFKYMKYLILCLKSGLLRCYLGKAYLGFVTTAVIIVRDG